jgi:nitrate/TMAO reductase-like tetraheme cytochrome c subunit
MIKTKETFVAECDTCHRNYILETSEYDHMVYVAEKAGWTMDGMLLTCSSCHSKVSKIRQEK